MAWDCIVIGSGIGGLTAAVTLARAGMKVLVIEQHYLPGGWTHSFTLEGHTFSPGVHYLGELDRGGGLRRLFEGLGVGPHLTFRELNTDGIDHLLVGGERFDVPKGRERHIEQLTARFPSRWREIRRYFDVLQKVRDEVVYCEEGLTVQTALKLPFVAPTLCRWGMRTLEPLHRTLIADPLLDDLLSARCGNHGLAPSAVSLPIHAAMIGHYLEGGYYPEGGARSITAAFIKALRARRGDIVVRTRVRRILVERGRVVGVELDNGEPIFARYVVSNVDASITYERLLPPGTAPRQQRRARKVVPSVSALSLFAVADMDLAARGYDSGNYWWFRNPGVASHYEAMARRLPDGAVDGLFLSISSLKDPGLAKRGKHSLEMFTFVPYHPFTRWRDSTTGERGAAYEDLKRRLTSAMLDAAEHIIPGLRKSLTFTALGTPLTNDFYCATREGACYGIAKTPFQVGPFAFAPTSPVKNLFLCGASTMSHGVAACAISGLAAARALLGFDSIQACLGDGDGELRIVPAGEPSSERRRDAREVTRQPERALA